MDSGQPQNSSPLNASATPPSRILGTGEMADRVRAHDWSATPLGPIDNWSKELLTIVNLTLCSPSPARTMWGPEFILIYNDGYRPIPGPRHPAALGKPAREVYTESWSVVGPLLEKAFATGETFFYEKLLVPLPTVHGMRNFYLNYSFNPIYENGKIAGLFGPLQDVTGEVTTTHKLRESEARATRILQSIGDAVIVTDVEAHITHINPIAEKLTGWPFDEAQGRPLTEIFRIVNEHTREPAEGPTENLKRFGAIAGLAGNIILTARDGAETFIDHSSAPIRDEAGSVTGVVLVFRDITEVKRAESALLQSEKLAAVGRLASSIAHEINNPLESVMNLLYLARKCAVNEEAKEFLELADQELRRVSIIANQTLRFHKQLSNPQAISSADLFSTVLSIHQGRVKNSSIKVEKRLLSLQPVVCFEGDIRQVLNNLVGNAIDAMPNGGRLHIRSRNGTHWPTDRKGLVLSIADTGCGMPPEVLKNIFEAFFTTKGMGGTGLGLWVSQEIVTRHNGALKVRSSQREGRCGTVFTLFLPFEAECH